MLKMRRRSEIRRVPEAEDEDDTRERILSAAGEVFAEHGFDRATVRAITDRAGVNVAAINYHFRDKAGLYRQVLRDVCAVRHAFHQTVTQAPSSPERRLEIFIRSFLTVILDPARPKWKARLMAREMADPTSALDDLVENVIRPLRDQFLTPTLRELTGGRLGRRELRDVSASVMGQCLYHLQGQPITQRLHPDFKITAAEIDRIADHITRFSLGAIVALDRLAPENPVRTDRNQLS